MLIGITRVASKVQPFGIFRLTLLQSLVPRQACRCRGRRGWYADMFTPNYSGPWSFNQRVLLIFLLSRCFILLSLRRQHQHQHQHQLILISLYNIAMGPFKKPAASESSSSLHVGRGCWLLYEISMLMPKSFRRRR